MKIALSFVNDWYLKQELQINFEEPDVIPFTGLTLTGRNILEWFFSEKRLSGSDTWPETGLEQVTKNKITHKATAVYWSCQSLFGKALELHLKIIYWLC